MKVRVRLFSVFRERAGTSESQLEVPDGATLGAVVAALNRHYPRLDVPETPGPVLFSLNREYATREVRVREGDEVAIFPPVSGGSTPPGPLTIGRNGVLLLSGGFDSPVAGDLALANGRQLEAVHFSMEPFTDDASVRKARVLAHQLGIPRLTVIPIGDELAEFTRHCEHRHYFVLMKRLMMRIAEEFARRGDASFLVTGENLGQVSSQTLPNLAVIDAATTLPILRPLLGYDKQDIIRHAMRLGTFETSKGPEICDVLGPKHPSTASTAQAIQREEAKLDVDALVRRALAKASTVTPGPAGAASPPSPPKVPYCE